jgi:hypothetical protein
MAEILSSRSGTVTVSAQEGPQIMRLDGVNLSQTASMIVTGMRFARSEGIQVTKALSGAAYTYAFGEVPGNASVTGKIFFQNACDPNSSRVIANLNAYYSSARAYSGGSRILSIGGAALKVVLTGLEAGMEAGPVPIGSFTLSYTILPSDFGTGGRS